MTVVRLPLMALRHATHIEQCPSLGLTRHQYAKECEAMLVDQRRVARKPIRQLLRGGASA
jgi:hypothetical protein